MTYLSRGLGLEHRSIPPLGNMLLYQYGAGIPDTLCGTVGGILRTGGGVQVMSIPRTCWTASENGFPDSS